MKNYQHKVITWAAGRKFLFLTSLTVMENRPPCDACGSKRVKTFCLLEYGNNHYLIGRDCSMLLHDNDLLMFDARIMWKDTPFWRDVEAIARKAVAEKQK
jgi:hypothetical protein